MKQKNISTYAVKVEHYEVPQVDGKKFGRAPQTGILEIVYFKDEVRLKLMHPAREIPVSDVMVPMDIFEQSSEILLKCATRVAQWNRDSVSGSLIRTANLNIAI